MQLFRKSVCGPLRVATFGVRGRAMHPPEVGLHAEDQVLSQRQEQIGGALAQAVAKLSGTAPAARAHDHRIQRRIGME